MKGKSKMDEKQKKLMDLLEKLGESGEDIKPEDLLTVAEIGKLSFDQDSGDSEETETPDETETS